MAGLLSEMAQSSLARLAQARAVESETALWTRAADTPRAPRLKLCPEGFDIIAECKLHSPSAGDLSSHTTNIHDRIAAYAQGGAAAVSVLTEPTRFGGTLAHLEEAVRVLAPFDVPAMRKDFLVDPYQVMEARVAGAGGVLVIIRMLDRGRITALLDCAAMLKMFVLLEAFDAADLAIAHELLAPRKGRDEQVLVGLNCRCLETLSVDLGRLTELADQLPPGVCHVAESGVASKDDVRVAVDLGYRAALIGTTLMNAPDPCSVVTDLLAFGRERAMAVRTRRVHIDEI